MDAATGSESDPEAIGATRRSEAEAAPRPVQPSWARAAFLRAGVASALGGLACLGYSLIAGEDMTSGLWLSLAGVLGGVLVFAHAAIEHMGWGGSETPNAPRVLGFSALAGATTSVLCFAIQLQSTYSTTVFEQGHAEAWATVQQRMLDAWDFPVARVAVLGCFGVAAGFSCLARGCGLRLLEQGALAIVGTLPLGLWVVLRRGVVEPEGARVLVSSMLGVAALLFPCASWAGDWLQRRRWELSPAPPTRRRLVAWTTVGVALLLGPLAGLGIGAWKQHQDDELKQLRELRDEAAQWDVAGLVRPERLIEWREQIERVGLRGSHARRLHAKWAPLGHWLEGRSPSPPVAVGQATVEELYLDRSAYRGSQGDGAGALADCEASLGVSPSHEALATRAWLRRELDPKGAAADYRRAFEAPRADVLGGVYADSPDLWLRAMFFRELGDLESALEDCEAGLQLEEGRQILPPTVSLTQLRIDLCLRRGDVHRAAHYLGEARRALFLEEDSDWEAYLSGLNSLLHARPLPPPMSYWRAVTDLNLR